MFGYLLLNFVEIRVNFLVRQYILITFINYLCLPHEFFLLLRIRPNDKVIKIEVQRGKNVLLFSRLLKIFFPVCFNAKYDRVTSPSV